jgi:hypothetical protein
MQLSAEQTFRIRAKSSALLREGKLLCDCLFTEDSANVPTEFLVDEIGTVGMKFNDHIDLVDQVPHILQAPDDLDGLYIFPIEQPAYLLPLLLTPPVNFVDDENYFILPPEEAFDIINDPDVRLERVNILQIFFVASRPPPAFEIQRVADITDVDLIFYGGNGIRYLAHTLYAADEDILVMSHDKFYIGRIVSGQHQILAALFNRLFHAL